MVAGDGIEPSTSRFSVARSYQLSYPAEEKQIATQTGLEPATSAVTGRRANQLRYWANINPDNDLPTLLIWRPQRDLNPCYRRERAMS